MSDLDPYDLVVKNLPLPNEPFLVVLKSVLGKLEFNVAEFRDVYGWKSTVDPLVHYRAEDSRGSIALFYVPEELIVDSKYLSALFGVASEFTGRVNGIFVFSGAKSFGFAHEEMLRKMADTWVARRLAKGARIFKYEAIEYLADLNAKENGLGSVKEMLLFKDIFTAPEEKPLITHEQYVLLVDVLVRKARVFDFDRPSRYFSSLLRDAELSDIFRTEADNFTGNVRPDAQGLIDKARSQKINSANRSYTTLGSLLKPLLQQGAIDEKDQLAVAEIICGNELYLNPEELKNLATRFGIPAKT